MITATKPDLRKIPQHITDGKTREGQFGKDYLIVER